MAHQKFVSDELLFSAVACSFPSNGTFPVAAGEERLRGELPKRRKIGEFFAPHGTNISWKGIGMGLSGKGETQKKKKSKKVRAHIQR
jgi:hypothetical protein